MNTQEELRMYAIAAAHFIVANIPDWLDKINSVILFGSVAQGRVDKDSDIDLFFDTNIREKQRNKLRPKIRKLISQFRMSQEALKFKLKGISNEISFFVGNLEEWSDLKKSISATGIVLYGKYRGETTKTGLKHHLLVFWKAEGKKRTAFLNKLYGYKIKGKKYSGLIERRKGIKIGKSAAMMPVESKDVFFKTLEKYNINYSVIEVFAY